MIAYYLLVLVEVNQSGNVKGREEEIDRERKIAVVTNYLNSTVFIPSLLIFATLFEIISDCQFPINTTTTTWFEVVVK